MFGIKRQDVNTRYLFFFLTTVIISYLMILVVPFTYDQFNKRIYIEARQQSNLVIQEFQGLFEDRLNLPSTPMTSDRFLDLMASKKFISLDYVTKMQQASDLSYSWFAVVALFLGVFTWIIVYLSLILEKLTTVARAIFFWFAFVGPLGAVHVFGFLPHSNLKFHYIFSTLCILILVIGDFLHRVSAYDKDDKIKTYSINAMQEIHKKWTALLMFSISILTVVFGTIAFNTISYVRVVFGDGFIIAPMTGIFMMSAYLVALYSLIVARNLALLIRELERDMHLTLNPPILVKNKG